MGRILLRIAVSSLAIALSGCVAPGRPVIAERAPVLPDDQRQLRRNASGQREYVVHRGDTLYSIAYRFELDPNGFARANGISAPYTIYPGQVLRLVNQYPGVAARSEPARPPLARTTTAPAPVAGVTTPSVAKPRRAQPTPRPTETTGVPESWVWPAAVGPSGRFTKTRKGIDFDFAPDDAERQVLAAGRGQVVYAGNGIGGYEHLIIIKHSESLLTAYSFDGRLATAERASVKAGQHLADIRSTGRGSERLHFELRKDGNPIDPGILLP